MARPSFVINSRKTAIPTAGCRFRLAVGRTQGSTPWGAVGLVVLAHIVVLVLLTSTGKGASMGKIFFSLILQTVSAFQINTIAGLLLPT